MNTLPRIIPSVVPSSTGPLRVTTDERYQLTNLSIGTQVFDTDLGRMFVWNNGWFLPDGQKLVLFGLTGADPDIADWTVEVSGDPATLTQQFNDVLMFPSGITDFDNTGASFGGSGASLDLSGLPLLVSPTCNGNSGITNIFCLDNCDLLEQTDDPGQNVVSFFARNCPLLDSGYTQVTATELVNLSNSISVPNFDYTSVPTQTLILDDCTGIEFIDVNGSTDILSLSARNNTSCETINIYAASNLQSIDVTGNTALTFIDADNCPNLTSITGLGTLVNLEDFRPYSSGLVNLDFSGPDKLNFTYLDFNSCPDLESVNIASCIALETIYGYACPSLQNFDARPAKATLQYVDIEGDSDSDPSCTSLNFQGCDQMTDLYVNDLRDLVTLNVLGCSNISSLFASNDHSLVTVDLSSCIVAGNFYFDGCDKLTTVIPPPFADFGPAHDFSGCNLSGASVSAIIFACNLAGTPGSVDISGGTNTPPTGSTLTRILALIDAGWTITYNS